MREDGEASHRCWCRSQRSQQGRTNTALLGVKERESGGSGVFLDAGADINLADKNGKSPLHFASKFERAETVRVVKLLLDAGADFNRTDDDGKTPLHFASQRKRAETVRVVKLLLDVGADFNRPDKNGGTPLSYASMERLAGLLRLLLGKWPTQIGTDGGVT